MSVKNMLKARWVKNNTPKTDFSPIDVILWFDSSEKSYTMSGRNKYVFIINKLANKIDVKNAFEKLYDKKPLSVSILYGKKKSRYNRVVRKEYKKAIITLDIDDKIEIV